MLFNSPEFLLLFLPVVIVGFYALRRWGSDFFAFTFLVLASLFFYGWWEPRYVALILGSIGFNFVVGRMMIGAGKRGAGVRLLLSVGVGGNLLALAYFKYTYFLVEFLGCLTETRFTLPEIILPLAISFFTFQQIAYLVDISTGKTDEPSFISYCLFVTFFPQLIAGPIVHHHEMIPQFFRRDDVQEVWRNLAVGLTITSIGLFKKVILSDKVAIWADQSFALAAQTGDISFIEAWVGVISFSLQIYFDFSGYSDMAIGLARIFGIKLPLNFASPYKATSIIEFWRRWHMTLSRFLRDYLYFPLGGNKLGNSRRYVNLTIVMVLGGLWHGANWTFVMWGALHGAFLMANHGWRMLNHRTRDFEASGTWTFPARLITFLSVSVAWGLFRSESLASSITMLRGIVGLNGFVLPQHYGDMLEGLAPILERAGVLFGTVPVFGGGWQIVWLTALVVVVWFWPNTQEIMREQEPGLDFDERKGSNQTPAWLGRLLVWRAYPVLGAVGGTATIVLALRLLQGTSGEFIYFQF